MRPTLPALAMGIAIAACPPAKADCKCRARGVVASEGQTLCIATPGGTRLARCGKVSNVASWTFLEGPCPQASLGITVRQVPAMTSTRQGVGLNP